MDCAARRIRWLACTLLATVASGCARDPVPSTEPVAGPAERGAPGRVVAGTLGESASTAAAPIASGRWFLRDDPTAPSAIWGAPHSEAVLSLTCDAREGRIVLEREAIGIPADTRLLAIDADGTRMDYPAEYVPTTLGANLVTSIALDAPILDRMLGASQLSVTAGGETLVTASPRQVLASVVETCRAHH